jgi:hypothetical protein
MVSRLPRYFYMSFHIVMPTILMEATFIEAFSAINILFFSLYTILDNVADSFFFLVYSFLQKQS